MDAATQLLSLFIVVIALAMVMVGGATMRRVRRSGRPFPALRPMPAYDSVNRSVGLAIESNQPMHLGLGSSGLGGASTMVALASAELFYQATKRAAVGDVAPIVTLSGDASALPLAQDTLRRAYRERQRLSAYRYVNARWYPQGARRLAYAAAISAMMHDERISTSFLVGTFGTELALIMEASARRKQPASALSDQLDGQAVAWAFSDHVFIGEEIFNAGAYLGQEAGYYAQVITTSGLRIILVAVLLALLIFRLTQSGA